MQEVLGYFQEWLENSEESLENFSNKKEMREQLKLKNFITEEKKTLEIIPTLLGELQPRKLEEINYRNCADLLPDTYMLYPTGGYHPFYGVPNTFPRYQLPIWPYVKRIKKGRQALKMQIKPRIHAKRGYANITLITTGYHKVNSYTQIKKKWTSLCK